jgi:hypothetical protein
MGGEVTAAEDRDIVDVLLEQWTTLPVSGLAATAG